MPEPLSLAALEPLVELVVSATDASLCERVLLEAVRAASGARAAALWRGEPGAAGCWRRVIASGDPSALPADALVAAALSGAIDGELGSRQLVLGPLEVSSPLALGRPTALGLSLGGPFPAEANVELADALFVLFAQLDLAAEAGVPHAALPQRSGSSTEERRWMHDLRGIVASLNATADLLRHFDRELAEREREEAHCILDRDCRRLGRFLVDACGKRSEAPRDYACEEVVRDVVASMRRPFAAAGIAVAAALEPVTRDLPLGEVELRRIVQNLLSNALEASLAVPADDPRRATAVTVEWRRVERGRAGVQLAVEDDGPGFAEGDGERAFEDGYSAGKGAGSGLGLGVVRELVGRAGGNVRAAGRPGGGARVEAWVPFGSREHLQGKR